MNEPSLLPPGSRRSLVSPVVGGAAVLVLGLVLLGAVLSASVTLLGVVIPIALIAMGARLVADQRPVLGWAGVGLGGVMLLDELPLIALLAGAGVAGWLLAKRWT